MAILSHSWETDPSTWILCYEGVGLVGETAVLFTIAPAMVLFVSCYSGDSVFLYRYKCFLNVAKTNGKRYVYLTFCAFA